MGTLVSIVGPESTGKTTLAAELARRLAGVWLPEYARDYLTSPDYDRNDLEAITREQLNRETDFVRSCPNFGVLDTDGIVLHVWWFERFHEIPRPLAQHLNHQQPRCYLLTKPDLAWAYDPLRESRDSLDLLFAKYEETLALFRCNYGVVTGSGSSRLNNAMKLIQTYMLNSSTNREAPV